MAISAPHYRCLRELHRRGELPQGGSILEIGEANWYGDMPLTHVLDDIQQMDHSEELTMQFNGLTISGTFIREDGSRIDATRFRGDLAAYDFVKLIYQMFFGSLRGSVKSIDMHGTPVAEKFDLNIPTTHQRGKDIRRPEVFTTVINHGTAEHIFNIAQVFRTMHDHCSVGGLMIHESPFTGWIDHGFYCIQPTLYYDLAAANGYKLVYMAVEQIAGSLSIEIHDREQLLKMAEAGCIPHNSLLYVAMRKETDAEFKIPMQGVYAGTVSGEATKAWKELR